MNNHQKSAPAVVLLVEDEPLVRLMGVSVLSDAGYIVIEASDSDEALRKLETCRNVNLLFTDVNMPGQMDGIELARMARVRWPNIRLLIVSGRAQPGLDRMPQGGQFLQKPYDFEVMLKQVRELLASSPGCELDPLPKAS